MTTPTLISRETLLASKGKRRFDVYPIPDLGNVRLRSLMENERSAYEVATQASNAGLESAKRRLIQLTVVDGDGNPLLSAEDVDQLAQIDGRITGDIFSCAIKHCGFKPGDIEALVGNSEATPADSSR